MTLTDKSGHLAWCVLMALALARQNGYVLSSAQETAFTISVDKLLSQKKR